MNGDSDPTINYFNEYYMPLIGNIPFFDQAVKKEQAYEKLVEMSRNNDYITQNFLDYMYHQIVINLLT